MGFLFRIKLEAFWEGIGGAEYGIFQDNISGIGEGDWGDLWRILMDGIQGGEGKFSI